MKLVTFSIHRQIVDPSMLRGRDSVIGGLQMMAAGLNGDVVTFPVVYLTFCEFW